MWGTRTLRTLANEDLGTLAENDPLTIQGDFIYPQHNEPRVQICLPKEETFPIPLKYIDVTGSTHADLDVMQEKRLDDYWDVDANRNLSDSWKGFTQFTSLKEKPPKGCTWSGARLTKVQATTRPDNVWPEVSSEQLQDVCATTIVEWGGGGHAQCLMLLVTRFYVVLNCVAVRFLCLGYFGFKTSQEQCCFVMVSSMT